MHPVDLGVSDRRPEELAGAVREALRRDDVDAVVVVYVPAAGHRRVPSTPRPCGTPPPATEKPVVTTFLAVDGLPEHLAVLGRDGGAGRGSVPSYPTPERAVRALAHAVRYAPGGTARRGMPELRRSRRATARALSSIVAGGDGGGRAGLLRR